MITPTSSSPAAAAARILDWWAATVYSATSSATSPSSGTFSSHWPNAIAHTARNTADGQTRRNASGAMSAAWMSAVSSRANGEPTSHTVDSASSTAAASASAATRCVSASRMLRPNSPRLISSGGWSSVRCSPMNSVSVLNARPSWSLTGSVPAITVRLEDDFPGGGYRPQGGFARPVRRSLGLLTVT